MFLRGSSGPSSSARRSAVPCVPVSGGHSLLLTCPAYVAACQHVQKRKKVCRLRAAVVVAVFFCRPLLETENYLDSCPYEVLRPSCARQVFPTTKLCPTYSCVLPILLQSFCLFSMFSFHVSVEKIRHVPSCSWRTQSELECSYLVYPAL